MRLSLLTAVLGATAAMATPVLQDQHINSVTGALRPEVTGGFTDDGDFAFAHDQEQKTKTKTKTTTTKAKTSTTKTKTRTTIKIPTVTKTTTSTKAAEAETAPPFWPTSTSEGDY